MIVDIVNKHKNEIFSNLDLPFNIDLVDSNIKYVYDQNSHNPPIAILLKRGNLKLSYNTGPAIAFNLDINQEVVNLIRNDIKKFLMDEFYLSFKDSDYIYIPTNKYQLESEKNDIFVRELLFKCGKYQSRNIISSSVMSNNISYYNGFKYLDTTNNPIKSSLYYKIGDIHNGISVYNDMYLKYDDNRTFLWDYVKCYLSFDSIQEFVDSLTYSNKIMFTFNYHLSINCGKIIYYLSDENSPGYNLFISEMRDKKIDSILDGK
jgi:hypothetical protein